MKKHELLQCVIVAGAAGLESASRAQASRVQGRRAGNESPGPLPAAGLGRRPLLSIVGLEDERQISPLACLGAGGSRKATVRRGGKESAGRCVGRVGQRALSAEEHVRSRAWLALRPTAPCRQCPCASAPREVSSCGPAGLGAKAGRGGTGREGQPCGG